MKLLKILTEEKLSPIEKRIIGRMLKSELDPEEYDNNFNILKNDWLINDYNLIFKLVHVYNAMYNQIEDGDLSVLDTEDFSKFDFENIADDYDDTQIALSLYLNISPFDVEKQKYSHYGMDVYDTLEGEYAIGTEEEAKDANDSYVDDIINNQLEDYMGPESLVDYLIVDENQITYLAEEMADNRIENMSDDEILEEAGYSDEIEEKNDLESDLEELQDEISDLEFDLESINNDIQETISDLENPENKDDVEYFKNELEKYRIDKTKINDSISSKKDQIESINNRLEELGDLSNLIEIAKDELRDKISDDYKSEIEYNPIDYFKGNLGYTTKDFLNSNFFDLDKEGLHEYFGSDRAGNLSHYDGRERNFTYKGVKYCIYRTN